MLKKIDSEYKKLAALFAGGIVVTSGLYAVAQSIALKYVPYGVWNSEAYQQNWGLDNVIASTALSFAALSGVVTMFVTPIFTIIHYAETKNFAGISRENQKLISESPYPYNIKKKWETVYDVNLPVDYIALLGEDQNKFAKYFEESSKEKKISIVGDLINLKEDINPTLESWLVKYYAPIVDQAGIMGVGKH